METRSQSKNSILNKITYEVPVEPCYNVIKQSNLIEKPRNNTCSNKEEKLVLAKAPTLSSKLLAPEKFNHKLAFKNSSISELSTDNLNLRKSFTNKKDQNTFDYGIQILKPKLIIEKEEIILNKTPRCSLLPKHIEKVESVRTVECEEIRNDLKPYLEKDEVKDFKNIYNTPIPPPPELKSKDAAVLAELLDDILVDVYGSRESYFNRHKNFNHNFYIF
ncbi:hypothetical protein HK099_004976 [Clydaea vesicula]|uniref:Uncharacterized protein n=1 Tax=Clydaea vesicula TaxID=447962 RepID=A0AAD5U9L4_9FUNG|nr:hypothetical protein HK099_004976 [Clydaea vesicula]KAJ3391025.1 hypothetical protein HDU92_000182 [Lobulomyces angularis]